MKRVIALTLIMALQASGAVAFSDELVSGSAKDLTPEHRHWLEHEVRYIISDEERAYFLTLSGEKQREQFIRAFWASHDPTPVTLENEFKTEHYQRLLQADNRFGEDKTAPTVLSRKQIYVLLGEPEEVEAFNSDKLSADLEAWKYPAYPALGLKDPFYLLWVKEEGSSSYRLFKSGIEEPRSLLDPRYVRSPEACLRELFRIDMLLGHIVLSHLPKEHKPLMINNKAELRRALSHRNQYHNQVVNALAEGKNINSDERFGAILKILDGRRTSANRQYREIDLKIAKNAFSLVNESGERHLFMSYQLDGRELTLKDYYGRCYGVLNFRINIFDMSSRLVSALNDYVSVSFLTSDLSQGHSCKLVHLAALDLPPGRYRVQTRIRNPLDYSEANTSHILEIQERDRFLSISNPLFLLRGIREEGVGEKQTDLQYYPSTDMVLERGENAEIFFQITGTIVEQNAEVLIRYRASHNNRLMWQHQERVKLQAESPVDVYTHKTNFPTRRFAPGDYQLEVTVLTTDDRQKSTVQKFTVDHRMHSNQVTVIAHTTR